ncbi:exopolysaccharide biosynthesis polyprenyl glycosylphosphotransferase [Listeria rocourtiae]|uniref:Exopolysaccharide biosynthesis polyprenyl glycosylphosphotransferase n=2 Tax=Listeria rocourtiae TaxID=647910 RepID=A0A4R6ZQ78_9LIST|nr:exopolysaccharide biosynthesis polyprenyl glycosylphosphotransferase [Listeria rocourtiae]TDR54747.1 exopolysaccharide biosynthesis polyprenyl glycosylphosphotransferase [Listeria rocourtiae]
MDYEFRYSQMNAKKTSSMFQCMKRLFDLFFATTLLVLTSPVILVTVCAVKIESSGQIIYRQRRVGHRGNEFTIYKIRSMEENAEASGAKWAEKNDPRITKVGHFIRKTRIDELPQLWNVLKGEMSIIGPRPERPMFTKEFQVLYPKFTQRLVVKPGLTGWAQVNGGYDISPKEKLKLDLEYINSMSIKNEARILCKTIQVVLSGSGAR